MSTDEDKAAVRTMLEALKAFNSAIDAVSALGIDVEFSNTLTTLGKRNRTYVCTKMERVTVERISP